jgi:hypothetical protein
MGVLSSRFDESGRRVLRLGVGLAAACGLAWGVVWDLSVLTPVLAVSFLSAGGPAPTLRAQLGILLMIAAAAIFGLFIAVVLTPFPGLCLTVICSGLFYAFYLQASGGSPFVVLMLLMALLVIPLLGAESAPVAVVFAQGFAISGAAALFIVTAAFMLIPEPDTDVEAPEKASAEVSRHACYEQALPRALAMLPLVALFFSQGLVDSLLTLVFAAIFAQQPDMRTGLKGAVALVLANFGGGLLAVGVFGLLVGAPTFTFMIAAIMFLGVFFGSRIFSERPAAKLYGTALSTLLIIAGGAVTSEGDATTFDVLQRVFQIGMAAAYLIIAFSFIDRFLPNRERGGELEVEIDEVVDVA